MSERLRKGELSRQPHSIKDPDTRDAWFYEERGGLTVYCTLGPYPSPAFSTNRVGLIPLRSIKAYLKRRESAK